MVTKQVNEYEVQELRRTMSMKQIASYYGICLNTLYWWCKRHYVSVHRLTDYELEEALNSGKTPKEIAFEFNVNPKTIYYRINKIKEKKNETF